MGGVQIQLTRGGIALIDEADLAIVSAYRWTLTAYGYAATTARVKHQMHRLILGCVKGDGWVVDHINGDRLDNRRSNLRRCTRQENLRNRVALPSNSTSGVLGVHEHEDGRWRAQITVSGRRVHLGLFATKAEAARAYHEAAQHHFGEFASRLNAGA